MKYFYVAVKKEVVSQATFNDVQTAIDYFEKNYGNIIYEMTLKKIKQLKNRIGNYEQKMQNQCEDIKKRQKNGTCTWADLNFENILKNKILNSEMKLEKIQKCLDTKPVCFEVKHDLDKQKICQSDESQLILHISSIYNQGYIIDVVEEKYYCIGGVVESDNKIETARKEIDEGKIKNYCFLHMVIDNDEAIQKMFKEVSRVRTQTLRDYHKIRTRLKNIA